MLKAYNTALVLIDMQGKLASLMHDRDELYHNLQTLIKGRRRWSCPFCGWSNIPKDSARPCPK